MMRGAPPLGVWRLSPIHHLVVCTLCRSYLRAVLGYPPFWFKSAASRARAVRDPRGLIAEWGTMLPDDVPRASRGPYSRLLAAMVLPVRPPHAGWVRSIAAIVHEGDMIGVTIPRL